MWNGVRSSPLKFGQGQWYILTSGDQSLNSLSPLVDKIIFAINYEMKPIMIMARKETVKIIILNFI